MSQQRAGSQIIETLSTEMFELGSCVVRDGEGKGSSAVASDGMAAVKRTASCKERQHQRRKSEYTAEMTDDQSERLHVTEMPELLPGTSLSNLKQIAASHGALVRYARNRRTHGVTDAEYRKYATLCFGLIRDVNDFMRRVQQMEQDAVRLHHHEALVHSDLRPTSASQTTTDDGVGVDAYDGVAHDDMFLETEMPPLTPYETPVASAPSSPPRPSSPDGSSVDLMGA